jgi:hypothetical protein
LTSTASRDDDDSLSDPQSKLPLTPTTASSQWKNPLECFQAPAQGPEGSLGNPWLPRNTQETCTPPTPREEVKTDDLLARHQLLRREKIVKRLHDRKRAQGQKKTIRGICAFSSGAESESPPPFISHNGPMCYVKPFAKSNRKLIRNAICHVCLAGDVDLPAKKLALSVC